MLWLHLLHGLWLCMLHGLCWGQRGGPHACIRAALLKPIMVERQGATSLAGILLHAVLCTGAFGPFLLPEVHFLQPGTYGACQNTKSQACSRVHDCLCPCAAVCRQRCQSRAHQVRAVQDVPEPSDEEALPPPHHAARRGPGWQRGLVQQVRTTALLCATPSGRHVPSRLGPAAMEATAPEHAVMRCQCWAGQARSGRICSVCGPASADELGVTQPWNLCWRKAAGLARQLHSSCTQQRHSLPHRLSRPAPACTLACA